MELRDSVFMGRATKINIATIVRTVVSNLPD